MRNVLLCLLFAGLAAALPVALSPEAGAVNPACAECQKTVTKMQAAAKNANETYAATAIKYLDDNICANLPDSVQDTCKSLVEEEIPDIWEQIIDDYLDPKITCGKLGFCGKSETAPPPHPDAQCKLCKKAAAWLDANVFEDPEIDAKVAERLKQMCTKLADKGKPIETKCEEVIDDDAADLMAQIGKAVAAGMCQDIGACPKP
eukprot:CAMPEP_0206228162 /NCGR_PEP_ID=MMETSP0047_2-20121206/9023_1 /ASSEMBLY_ACC=CAM_ASM_000192 /TAXON_ID=195065 /ORGANISM="Chroomonas mesostigmatica_cf, Strain CCMP1168" /LENGTH=203 /DNA_ID=CAMNT_0053651389 /DNA_START=18 /DNA_END=629 /DNA_ORIENTATION=-